MRTGLSGSDQLTEFQFLCHLYDKLFDKEKSEFVQLVSLLDQRIIVLTNSSGQLSKEFLSKLTDISPELAVLIQRQYRYLSIASTPRPTVCAKFVALNTEVAVTTEHASE
jgi:hypothetical protein